MEDRSLLAVYASVSDAVVNEPEFGGPTTMEFTVRLSEPRPSVTIFNWLTNSFTATRGADYDENFGSVTFQPGETEQIISIPVFSDIPQEPVEQFYFELSNPFAGAFERLTDIHPNGGAASPQGFTEYNGAIYFTATDGVHGKELWKWDGVAATLVADINPGAASSSPGFLTVWNGALYFSAFTPTDSGEIWRYDGSTATRVTNFIKPQFIESSPQDLTVYKNELYFSTSGEFSGARDLYKVRTNHTTQKVVDLNPNGGDNPGWLTVYGNLLVFRATNGSSGNEMWTFDGSSVRQYEATPGSFSSDAGLFTEMDGILYFVATGYDSAGNWVGRELYQFDGAAISVAADIRPFEANSSPEAFVAYNHALYFRARGQVDAQGVGITEFWKYDGREASLVMSQTTDKAGLGTYAVFNNDLYFSANDPTFGPGIYRFDGVHLIFVAEFSTGDPLATYSFKTIGDKLYLRADDNLYGSEAWTVTPDVVIADGHAVGTIIDLQNDPPVAEDGVFDLIEDDSLNAAATATDPNGNPLTYEVVSGPDPNVGLLTFNDDGTFEFIPPTDYNGLVTFTFRASDGSLHSNIATVAVNVTPVNDAPRAFGDQASVNEDSSVTRQLTATDAEQDPLTFALENPPSHGSVTILPSGLYTYQPEPNYSGSDTFDFRVSDGQLISNQAHVFVTIHPVNDPPIGTNDSYAVDEDLTLDIAVPGVLANDPDVDGDLLTATLAVAPSHGTLTLNPNGSFTYKAFANYNGPDEFTYLASDGQATTGQITVALTVRPVNDAPVVEPGQATTNEETAAIGQLTGSDVEGDTLNFQLVGQPQHGTVDVTSNGNYIYRPAANYHGSDSFTFRASDGQANSNTAAVNITITPVNDPPTASPGQKTTNEDTAVSGQVTGSDVDGDTLSFQLIGNPQHGTVVLAGNGNYTYTPAANYNGSDSFTFRASDGQANSNTAVINLTITPVNDAPTANQGQKTTAEDTPASGQVTGSDVEGTPLTFQVVGNPQHGSVVMASNGNYSYTPAANYNGSDSFSFRANDGLANSNTAVVNITVTPVNDVPVAANDSITVDEDINLTFDVRSNDVDVDGNALTPQVITNPTKGTLTLNANKTFTYNPNTDYFGSDSFTYRVSDGTATSNVATVSITVRSQGETPTIRVTPSDPANTILLRDAEIEVAILSSDAFNAPAQVNIATVTFGKTGNEPSLIVNKKTGPKYQLRDVNGDGLLDVVLSIDPSRTGLNPGDTLATLRAKLNDGSSIAASDSVTVLRR